MMNGFELASEIMLDDLSGGVAGQSRHRMWDREFALQIMVQQTARSRLRRATDPKTRLAVQQLNIKQDDLVDF